MRVSMDSRGRVVAAGEGLYNKPVTVGERDNAVGNPRALAQAMRDQKAKEKAEAARIAAEKKAQKKAEQEELKAVAKAAREEEAFQREIEKYENAGEHPLMYLAALQSMSGENRDMNMPLCGYGLSTDGVPAYDRAMGTFPAGMGLSWGDVTGALSNVQTTASQVMNIVRTVTPASTPAPVVQATQQMVAPAGSPVVIQAPEVDFMTWMKQTRIGPVTAYQAMLGLGGLVGTLAVVKVITAFWPRRG